MQARTGGSPVYRYSFDRKIPIAPGTKIGDNPATAEDIGARHAGEIEYVFGALDSVPGVTWTEDDRRLSDQMMTYWSNFARTGDPNGDDLPTWPRYEPEPGGLVMHLDVTTEAKVNATRPRYEALDALATAARGR
jgi:para-nitrobenzyl esterase